MASSHVITPVLNMQYPKVSHAKGSFLYDVEGKRYLDACSGAVTASLGHAVPEIVDALTRQAERVAFAYRSQFTSEPLEELAAALARLTPGDLNWVFFVNSGSEALETALKIAVQYWQERGVTGKTRVLTRWLSYHEITLGALSMSGHLARRRRFAPLLADFASAPPPYCYRCPLGKTYPQCRLACADEVEAALRRTGPEHVAAFVVEPVIGAAGGAVVPPPEYLPRVREICDRHDVLLIADEVMTGIGRTGRAFAVEHWGVVPDLIAVGKGLGAGYTPLAATIVSERVVSEIRGGSGQIMSGHTYSGNPLSAAVGHAVLKFVESHHLIERAQSVGAELGRRLSMLAERHPIIGDVRGIGMLWGLEFAASRAGCVPFPPEAEVTTRVVRTAQAHGLLLYPALAGADHRAGDAVLVAPPLVIEESEMDLLVDLLDRTLQDVEAHLSVR